MKKILIRAGKTPFVRASAVDVLHKNLTLSNTGNLLFQHSFFRHIYDPDLQITAIQDGPFTDQMIASINENYDAIYLPFANAFRGTFRGGLKNWTSLIKKIKIPVVVVGVGAQCDSYNPVKELREINHDVVDFCSAVLDRSTSIGVRGEFTANYLNDIGIKNVDIIGCPSMFYYGSRLPLPAKLKFAEIKSLAFHFSPQSPANFGVKNVNISNQLSKIVKYISSLEDVATTYVAQDTQELRQMLWGIRGVTLSEYAPAFSDVSTIYPVEPHVWINDLRQYDVVLGTRIHGAIAAVLAGTSSFIVCHDSRTVELADWFGLPRLDEELERGEDITTDLLEEKIMGSAMLQKFPDRFNTYLSFLNKNSIKHALCSSAGANPHWEDYDKEIEFTGHWSTANNFNIDHKLLDEKIKHVYQYLSQLKK